MYDKTYFQTIIEELCWDTITEPVQQNTYLSLGIQMYCPGNYDLVINPKHCESNLLVNCNSMGIHLLFKTISDKIEWLLKYS